MQKINRFYYFIFIIISIAVLASTALAQKKSITSNMTLIPGGYFNLGSDQGYEDETPVVKVWIDSFFIDNTEVTNGEYKIFCDSTKRPYPANPPWDTAYFSKRVDHPVIYVSWDDASAYAKWVGKRLPSEVEWEKAAKAGIDTRYFCGDTITGNDANFAGKQDNDKWRHTSPVKSFPANKFGIFDMIGNVWEWCEDFYLKEYYFTITDPNPKGPKTGSQRIIRGGSWDSTPEFLRTALRGKHNPQMKNSNVGFRCAYSKPKP